VADNPEFVESETPGGMHWLSDAELQELEDRFRLFAKQSALFRDEIGKMIGLGVKGGSAAIAQANLEIARTMFSKWSLDTMVALYTQREAGFAQLRRLLPGISARVLSQRLKTLEGLGFVQRVVIEARPPRVIYVLTREGHTVSRLGEPIFLYLRARLTYGKRMPVTKRRATEKSTAAPEPTPLAVVTPARVPGRPMPRSR
jgi:DNA-binding HxlR family transcriptional regulator